MEGGGRRLAERRGRISRECPRGPECRRRRFYWPLAHPRGGGSQRCSRQFQHSPAVGPAPPPSPPLQFRCWPRRGPRPPRHPHERGRVGGNALSVVPRASPPLKGAPGARPSHGRCPLGPTTPAPRAAAPSPRTGARGRARRHARPSRWRSRARGGGATGRVMRAVLEVVQCVPAAVGRMKDHGGARGESD